MKLLNRFTFILMCCVLSLTACDDDDNIDYGENGIVLQTPVASDIVAPNATLECTVLQKEDVRIMGYGFCYGTTANPTIYHSTASTLPENGKLKATLEDLTDNTRYYVRAYATIYPKGLVYSPEVEITVGTVAEKPDGGEAETPAE